MVREWTLGLASAIILGEFAKLRKATVIFVCPHGNKSASTERILMKFDARRFFEKKKYVAKTQI